MCVWGGSCLFFFWLVVFFLWGWRSSSGGKKIILRTKDLLYFLFTVYTEFYFIVKASPVFIHLSISLIFCSIDSSVNTVLFWF